MSSAKSNPPAASSSGSGLFGGPSSNAAPSGGSVFGASSNEPAAQPSSGGLFGNNAPQKSTGGSDFSAFAKKDKPEEKPKENNLFGMANKPD